jgi:hypothetical protein
VCRVAPGRGHAACADSDKKQEERDSDKRQRVAGDDAIQKSRDDPAHGQRSSNTEENADECKSHTLVVPWGDSRC